MPREQRPGRAGRASNGRTSRRAATARWPSPVSHVRAAPITPTTTRPTPPRRARPRGCPVRVHRRPDRREVGRLSTRYAPVTLAEDQDRDARHDQPMLIARTSLRLRPGTSQSAAAHASRAGIQIQFATIFSACVRLWAVSSSSDLEDGDPAGVGLQGSETLPRTEAIAQLDDQRVEVEDDVPAVVSSRVASPSSTSTCACASDDALHEEVLDARSREQLRAPCRSASRESPAIGAASGCRFLGQPLLQARRDVDVREELVDHRRRDLVADGVVRDQPLRRPAEGLLVEPCADEAGEQADEDETTPTRRGSAPQSSESARPVSSVATSPPVPRRPRSISSGRTRSPGRAALRLPLELVRHPQKKKKRRAFTEAARLSARPVRRARGWRMNGSSVGRRGPVERDQLLERAAPVGLRPVAPADHDVAYVVLTRRS